jgi:Galactose oxidase, central domain
MVIETWRWTQKQDIGPSARALFSMVYNSTSKKVVLFGGTDGVDTLNDTWDWNDDLWVQRQNMGPPARAGHSMVYDDDKNVAVLFGGIDNTSILLGDTWELKVRVKT